MRRSICLGGGFPRQIVWLPADGLIFCVVSLLGFNAFSQWNEMTLSDLSQIAYGYWEKGCNFY